MGVKEFFSLYFRHVIILLVITWAVGFIFQNFYGTPTNLIAFFTIIAAVLPLAYGFIMLKNHTLKKILVVVVIYFAIIMSLSVLLLPVQIEYPSYFTIIGAIRANPGGILKMYLCYEEILTPAGTENFEPSLYCASSEMASILSIILSLLVTVSFFMAGIFLGKRFNQKRPVTA